MKIIKGFENEDIIVSDFGEWVGNDYIDYKAEYKRNQKFIEMLFDENKQLKDNWNNLKKIAKMHSGIKKKCYNGGLWFEIDSLLDKMQELEGSDSNE